MESERSGLLASSSAEEDAGECDMLMASSDTESNGLAISSAARSNSNSELSGFLREDEEDDCMQSSPAVLLAARSSSNSQLSGFLMDDEENDHVESIPDVPQAARLPEAFRWAIHVLQVLPCLIGEKLVRESIATETLNFSTHCSGIGAPEVAAMFLTCASRVTGPFPLQLVSSAMCDNLVQAKNILCKRCGYTAGKRGADSDPHVFGDIFEYAPHWERDVSNPETAMSALGGAMDALRPRHCSRHEQNCIMPDISGDISGTPCPPWSRRGKRRQLRDPRAAVTFVWMAFVLSMDLLWAIHENVHGFRTDLIDTHMQHAYWIWHLSLHPRDVGFQCMGRPRLYTLLISRRLRILRTPTEMLEKLRPLLQARLPQLRVEDIMTASDAEVVAFENELRRRKGLEPILQSSACWEYLLSPSQSKLLGF